MPDITEILAAIEQGDGAATEALLPIVYDELRRIAAAKLRRETPGQTLQTTALVHEAYLRLVRPGESETTPTWKSKGHFFAAAAEAMRRVLIDNARRKNRLKRQPGKDHHPADRIEVANATPQLDLLALDVALSELETHDDLKATVVKLRYFAGLTIEETAAALDISPATVKRHWYYARAWLRRQMGADETRPSE